MTTQSLVGAGDVSSFALNLGHSARPRFSTSALTRRGDSPEKAAVNRGKRFGVTRATTSWWSTPRRASGRPPASEARTRVPQDIASSTARPEPFQLERRQHAYVRGPIELGKVRASPSVRRWFPVVALGRAEKRFCTFERGIPYFQSGSRASNPNRRAAPG
jgi:hypothetical protein